MERHSRIKRLRAILGNFNNQIGKEKNNTLNLEQKAKIVKVLIEKGITQKSIAEQVNVSPQTVGSVIAGKARSHKIERIITELTGYKFPANKRVTRETAAQI